MKFRVIALCIAICSLTLFSSCSKDDNDEKTPVRTMLVYIVSNNSLSSYANITLNELIGGAAKENLNGGHLIVYLDTKNATPALYEIAENSSGVVVQNHVKDYNDQNSCDPAVMKSVINDVISLYPAKSYGLSLWSHGTAWLPSNYNNMLRSFGDDGGYKMEISDLAAGIPDNVFDFILFDACYMASIECEYALRNKADYIIASPTETMADSFPYQNILKYFFSDTPDLASAAKGFYDYYNALSGYNQTATVSVVQTSALADLATVMKTILAGKTDSDIYGLNLSSMQALEHLSASRASLLYDMSDFVKAIGTTDQFTQFTTALNKAVIYKAHTAKAFFAAPYASYTINSFCGLSIFVQQSAYPTLNTWYQALDWYKAIH